MTKAKQSGIHLKITAAVKNALIKPFTFKLEEIRVGSGENEKERKKFLTAHYSLLVLFMLFFIKKKNSLDTVRWKRGGNDENLVDEGKIT
jgi:hypothetical protein